MPVKLETPIIRTIALFEEKTRVHARDCIITENCVYFLVDPQKIGLAVGKKGAQIKDLRRLLGKPVKVFGYSNNPEEQIRNLIPSIKNVEVLDGTITISIPKEERTSVIGKNGSNIKVIKEILKRHFDIKNVRLR